MVLSRRNLPLFSQEYIGAELGLILTGKKPSAGWGTQVDKPEYSINAFFRKHNLPLQEEYFPVSRLESIAEWAAVQKAEDNDILVCFNYGLLYQDKYQKGQGHVCILDSIEKENVILIDPKENNRKYRYVKLEKLIDSMRQHGENNRGGFWIISDSFDDEN
jgi:hypothetical protein